MRRGAQLVIPSMRRSSSLFFQHFLLLILSAGLNSPSLSFCSASRLLRRSFLRFHCKRFKFSPCYRVRVSFNSAACLQFGTAHFFFFIKTSSHTTFLIAGL